MGVDDGEEGKGGEEGGGREGRRQRVRVTVTHAVGVRVLREEDQGWGWSEGEGRYCQPLLTSCSVASSSVHDKPSLAGFQPAGPLKTSSPLMT